MQEEQRTTPSCIEKEGIWMSARISSSLIWWFSESEKVYLVSSSTNGMVIFSKHTVLVTSVQSETQKATLQWVYAIWAEPHLYYTVEIIEG